MADQNSHLFQIQLTETNLSADQINQVAAAIRDATVRELLKLDFRIEELKPLQVLNAACVFR